jgi:hypothetical protein
MEAERRQVTVSLPIWLALRPCRSGPREEAAYTLMRSLSKLIDNAVREYTPPRMTSIAGISGKVVS